VTVGPDQVNVSITATIEIRGSGVDGDGTTGADAGAAAGGGAIAGVLWWVLKPVGLACPPPFEVPCILTF
jgi:hypothetical protein